LYVALLSFFLLDFVILYLQGALFMTLYVPGRLRYSSICFHHSTAVSAFHGHILTLYYDAATVGVLTFALCWQ